MNSLETSDAEAAAVAVAPRVTLADIEANIAVEYYCTGDTVGMQDTGYTYLHPSLEVLTICLLVLKNGYTVLGKAAPASEANFNRELGRKFAREDAVRQVWPLMGYELRQRKLNLTKAQDID